MSLTGAARRVIMIGVNSPSPQFASNTPDTAPPRTELRPRNGLLLSVAIVNWNTRQKRLEALATLYVTDEAQEGRESFLEKREPDWSPYQWLF